MNWRVTYRDKRGVLHSECFSAPSRNALFSLLLEKNIKPISVDIKKTQRKNILPWLKSNIVLWCALCLASFASIYLLNNSTKPEEEAQKPVRIKEKVQVRTISKPARPSPIKVTSTRDKPVSLLEELRIHTQGMSKEEIEQFHYEYLQSKRLDLTPKTNMPFRTGVERSLCKIFMTEIGDPPPSPPTTWLSIHDEAHLTEILIADNPIIEGDSEITKDAKEIVKLAKEEFRQFIKDGNDAAEFLPYYYNKLQEAWNDRWETAKEINRIAREEPEIAREFYEMANQRLKEKGIKPVTLSQKTKKRLGLEE